MKVKCKKLLMLLVTAVMFFMAFVPFHGFSIAKAEELSANPIAEEIYSRDEKTYCTATLDDDFADDCVLVVLKQNVSNYRGIAQEELEAMFSMYEFAYVKDIFSFPDASEELAEHLETVGFNQIVELGLVEPSKQNVLNMIKALEALDFVKSAEPNYFIHLTPVEPSISQQAAAIATFVTAGGIVAFIVCALVMKFRSTKKRDEEGGAL